MTVPRLSLRVNGSVIAAIAATIIAGIGIQHLFPNAGLRRADPPAAFDGREVADHNHWRIACLAVADKGA